MLILCVGVGWLSLRRAFPAAPSSLAHTSVANANAPAEAASIPATVPQVFPFTSQTPDLRVASPRTLPTGTRCNPTSI